MNAIKSVFEDVLLELKALRECGVKVPSKCDEYAKANAKELDEWCRNGMSITEIADLVRDLT